MGAMKQGRIGDHRRFTDDFFAGYAHRFVNDVQITIGAAHSGYPVMNGSFNASQRHLQHNRKMTGYSGMKLDITLLAPHFT